MQMSSSCTLFLLDHDKGSCMEVAKYKHGHGRIVQLPITVEVWILTYRYYHGIAYHTGINPERLAMLTYIILKLSVRC